MPSRDQAVLFRTDGVRGRVGRPPFDMPSLWKIGYGIARVCISQRIDKVVIGRDTRQSGPMIEGILTQALLYQGLVVESLGVLPTPAVAFAVGHSGAGLGIMITASHNPYHDNGIKLFAKGGHKVPPAWLHLIEQHYNEAPVMPEGWVEEPLAQAADEQTLQAYGRFCLDCVGPLALDDWHIVLDVAHGAMFEVAPWVLAQSHAKVSVLHNRPNGQNINASCGSTALNALQQAVLAQGADIGLAFDGDGDRLQVVSAQGVVLDGDDILWLLAHYFKLQDSGLSQVVGTIMSNLGLEQAFAKQGIELLRTDVGDQNMHACLLEHDLPLAAESSGHVLHLPSHATGDGLLAALWVLKACVAQGAAAKAFCDVSHQAWQHFAQAHASVPIPDGIEVAPAWIELLEQHAHQLLGELGRSVIRLSGTEPVVRIMVECLDTEQAQDVCQQLSTQLQACWGRHDGTD